ncbi:MAG: TniQ family protein [Anaerolineales bacterium]|nr:TniQ family protein [Anaerolineales bacterium]
MNPNRPDFFDVLPYHPPPEPFESMTGYLTRLAQSNGIKSARAVWAMCFLEGCGERPLPRNADFSLTSWEALPTVTTCSEADLLATTFTTWFKSLTV